MKYKKLNYRKIFLSLVCLNICLITKADEKSEVEESDSEDKKIVIFASKDLTNSGISSLVSSETLFLEDLNLAPTKISDIIVEVPGISTNGQGGLLQTFSVRGMSRWRIQTTLDGVPIVTDRRAGSAVSFIDPGLLGQVDLVKGAVSTLFGSGAIGGVVNLKPANFETSILSYDFNSFGNESGLLFGSNTGDLSYGIAYRNASDDVSSEDTPLNSGFEQLSAVIKSSSKLDDELTLSWMIVPSKGMNIGKSNKDYPNNKVTHYPSEAHLISKVSLIKDDSWAVELYAHIQDWQSEVVRVGKRKNIVDYYSLDWGGNTQFNWETSDIHGRVGFDWFKRSNASIDETQFSLINVGMENESYGSADFNRSNLDATESQMSVYSDAQMSVNSLDLHTGLRFSDFKQAANGSETDDNKLTGFLGTRYHFTESLNINFQLGTGFRFPSLTEKYFFGTTGRGEIVGNLNLKPELAFNKEVSLSHQIGNLNWSVTYFNVDIDDYIERVEIAPETLQYQNLTSGNIKGVEAIVNYQLSDNMKLGINHQYQKGVSDNGNALADISPNEYNLLFSYDESDWQFKASYKYRATKTEFADGELALGSVNLLDLSFQKALSDRSNIRLKLDNLLNKSYFETSDDLSSYSTGLTLSVKFDQYF